MADYNIKADITANTKGYEAGIKKAQESTKKFSTSLSKVIQGLGKNGLVGAMGSIGLASAGLTATLGAVVKIAKRVSQTIGECTDAYKKQLISERQLETAINNNPLVTGSAKKRLTEFASEMQKVSNYGDEELIPMMANLVSLGRTEEETMKIMSVAMDMSATGTMSLDTAITQLNATLNGNIGRLGQQNAELKGLTEEELKSGKAIEILGDKFKGLSQATLDTSTQLKNIKGDFKEAIGEFTLPTSDMWNKFWIGFYDKGISVIKQFDEYMDKTIIGKGISEALSKELKKITDERQRRLYSEDEIHLLSDTQLKALENYLSSLKKLNKEQQVLLQVAKDEAQSRIFLAKLYEDMDREEAERQKTIQKQKEAENEIADLKDEYLKKIAEQEAKWQHIKEVTGEQVSNEEKIKFYQDSLVDLMTKAGGQITTNNQLYKDQIAIIQKLQAELDPEEKETSNTWVEKIRQQSIERLQAEKEALMQTAEYERMTNEEKYNWQKKYNDQLKQLNLERIVAEREQALKSVEDYENAEEEKARIMEYYQNLIIDNAKQYATSMEKEGKKAGKSFAQGFSTVVSEVKKIMSKSIQAIKTVLQSIKKIANIKGVFSKLFQFNTNDALDGLLEFEDKVLTFFVETMPKLPSFVKSAVQSIAVLFKTLAKNVDKKQLANIIKDMVKTLSNNLPSIIKDVIKLGGSVLSGLMTGIRESLPDLIMSAMDIINEIVNAMIYAMPQIFAFIKNMGEMLVPKISEMLDSLITWLGEFLQNGIPVFMQVLFDFLGLVLKKIPSIVSVLLEALPTLIDSFLKGLVDFIESDFPEIVAELIKMLPTLIKISIEIVSALVKALPEILGGLITGIVKIFTETDWGDLAKGIFQGLIDGFKSVGEALSSLMKAPINIIIKGLNGIISGLNKISIKIPDWVPSIGGKKFGVSINKIPELARGTQSAYKGLTLVGEAGPELVNFKGGEQVINNRNTQKLLTDTGKGGSVFNVNFYETKDTTAFAMMRQLKQYQRNLAFNSVI